MAERKFVRGMVHQWRNANLLEFRPDPEQGYRQILYFQSSADITFGVHQWATKAKRGHIALVIEDFDPARPVAGKVVGVANP